MSIIASCGHILTDDENMGNTLCVKEFDRLGKKALCYTTLCKNCFKSYEEKGLILKTKKEKDSWLTYSK